VVFRPLAFAGVMERWTLIIHRHQYTSLPLISEEEFLELKPECKELGPHEMMIERLNNEKEVREALEKQRKELLSRKHALTLENKKRKDDLASLDEQLKKFIEVSLVVGYFGDDTDCGYYSLHGQFKRRFKRNTRDGWLRRTGISFGEVGEWSAAIICLI
jgi:hypothetical protein